MDEAAVILKNRSSPRQRVFKRGFDILFTILLLPLVVPLIIALSIAVFLGSRGRIFYRGLRAGQYGRPFRIYKFRTMIPNAEEVGGGTTALNDSRVTRVGRFMRRYKLDELPQVINVLRGEMSWVGPRPELLRYTETYSNAERRILSVKPGITDYSSIEFHNLDERVGAYDADRVYEEEIYPRKNELRLKYVGEQSFYNDMKILLLTLITIIRKPLDR